jgi:hypothetical protein
MRTHKVVTVREGGHAVRRTVRTLYGHWKYTPIFSNLVQRFVDWNERREWSGVFKQFGDPFGPRRRSGPTPSEWLTANGWTAPKDPVLAEKKFKYLWEYETAARQNRR